MSNQLGRLTQQILTNKSGSTVAYGDVVVVDLANANAFTTTTTLQYVTTPIGVCIEPNGILNNAQGMIAFGGAIGKINLDTSAAIGDWIHSFTVAGQGHPHAAPADTGDFAVALEASSTPKALLISGGGGSGGTDVQTVAVTLTNKTGVTVNQGDVVFIDDNNASSFNSDTNLSVTEGYPNYLIGVVLDTSIINAAQGKIAISGYVPKISLDGSSTIGNYLIALGASSQAHKLSNYPSDFVGYPQGVFGETLDTGTTPPAIIWNPPSRGQEIKITTVTGVDLNTGTAQTLTQVPTLLTMVITRVVIRNVSTSLTTVSFSIGFNSASYNDVIADATHIELTGNTLYTVLQAMVGATVGSAASFLKLKNNILQGAPATCTVDVFGYLLF